MKLYRYVDHQRLHIVTKDVMLAVLLCKTDIVGSRTFSAQEIASLEIETSLSR